MTNEAKPDAALTDDDKPIDGALVREIAEPLIRAMREVAELNAIGRAEQRAHYEWLFAKIGRNLAAAAALIKDDNVADGLAKIEEISAALTECFEGPGVAGAS